MGSAAKFRVWLLCDQPTGEWERFANVLRISRAEVQVRSGVRELDPGAPRLFDPDLVIARIGDRAMRHLETMDLPRVPLIGVFRHQLHLRYTALLDRPMVHIHDEARLSGLSSIALALAAQKRRPVLRRPRVALLDPDPFRRRARARALVGAGFDVVFADQPEELERIFAADGGAAATIRSDDSPTALSRAAGVVFAARPVDCLDLAGERTLAQAHDPARLPAAVRTGLDEARAERRRWPRVPAIHPVRFRIDDRTPWSYAMTSDVSKTGVRLQTATSIAPGTPLEMEVEAYGES